PLSTLHSFPTRRSSDLPQPLNHFRDLFRNDFCGQAVNKPPGRGDVACEKIRQVLASDKNAGARRMQPPPVTKRTELTRLEGRQPDRKSTRLNSSHVKIS